MGCCRSRLEWPHSRVSDNYVAIVTGANTGIGYHTAKHLAMMGAKVIIGCRSEEKAQSAIAQMKKEYSAFKTATPPRPFDYDILDDLDIEYITLDLASLQSVMTFVTEFKARYTTLRLLVCNAGIALAPLAYTEDGMESHFQTNYLGHLLMTFHLLPTMRQSGPDCRIINVSSDIQNAGQLDLRNIQAKVKYSRTTFYANSKLYQVMVTLKMAQLLKGSDVTVYSLTPGYIDTTISRNFEDDCCCTCITKVSRVLGLSQSDVLQGAATTLHVAMDGTTPALSGSYFKECAPSTPSRLARNAEKQEILWNYSLEQLRDHLTPDLIPV